MKIVHSRYCPPQELHLCEDASGDFVLIANPNPDHSKDFTIREHRSGNIQTADELLKFFGEPSIS